MAGGETAGRPARYRKRQDGGDDVANRIKAINAYRPRIKLGMTVKTEELVEYVANRTGLNRGEILLVLTELHEAIAHYNRLGRGVRLEGLGTYLPNVRLDGSFDVQHRLDPRLKGLLNEEGFAARIANRRHAGKTADELVALWNEEHPDDPVTD
jgi:hypothetical protein